MNIMHCIFGVLRYFRILPHVLVEGYRVDDAGWVDLYEPEICSWFRSLDDAEGFALAILADDPEWCGYSHVIAVTGCNLSGYVAEVVREASLPYHTAKWNRRGLRLHPVELA